MTTSIINNMSRARRLCPFGIHRQLLLSVRFIRGNRSMLAALQKKDWKAFARLYNGPAYAQNRYDEKLSTAYSSFNKQGQTVLKLGGVKMVIQEKVYIILYLCTIIRQIYGQITL